MLEYEWDYAIVCDECGDKRTYHNEALSDAIDDAKKHGWLVGGGLHLCKECRQEHEKPCMLCKFRMVDGTCQQKKSKEYNKYVLSTMHCDEWEEQ